MQTEEVTGQAGTVNKHIQERRRRDVDDNPCITLTVKRISYLNLPSYGCMEPYKKYSGGTGLGAEVGVGGGEKVDLCQQLNMLLHLLLKPAPLCWVEDQSLMGCLLLRFQLLHLRLLSD